VLGALLLGPLFTRFGDKQGVIIKKLEKAVLDRLGIRKVSAAALSLLLSSSALAAPFSIVVLPNTQNYAQYTPETYANT